MMNKPHEHITVDPRVMVGQPVIKGTRITVESVIRKLAAGWTVEQVIEAHPHLAREDILATIEHRKIRTNTKTQVFGEIG